MTSCGFGDDDLSLVDDYRCSCANRHQVNGTGRVRLDDVREQLLLVLDWVNGHRPQDCACQPKVDVRSVSCGRGSAGERCVHVHAVGAGIDEIGQGRQYRCCTWRGDPGNSTCIWLWHYTSHPFLCSLQTVVLRAVSCS